MAESKHRSDERENLHALRSEELAAQKTAVVGRTVALAVIAILVTYLSPWPGPIYTYTLLLVFVGLGWGAWLVAKADWGRAWHQYAFIGADFALLTFTLLYPNPMIPFDYPPQFSLRYDPFIYFFVLLTGLAYVYQPRLVLWGGVLAVICWGSAIAWLASLPDTVLAPSNDAGMQEALKLFAQPTYIDIGPRIQEMAVILIAAGFLALAIRRSRRIALRQAVLAREKANLGRYFPKKTAQMLAERNDAFAAPSEHRCAVLFADLIAFTTWSERHTPAETIALLREIHALLAEIVFRHDGTLDKFIGDGLMATFGTPEPSPNDASCALAAALEMPQAFARWQQDDPAGQKRQLQLAVGAHFGPVVVGNIGTDERLEFAVLGDTVNVASRLETATRQIGCRCLVSAALVQAAQTEGHDTTHDWGALVHHGPLTLRGRSQAIDVYRY